jgi:ATP-binding cassette, subfamily B, bacterial
VLARAGGAPGPSRAAGPRQVAALLWSASPALAVATAVWMAASALLPAFVVVALGRVVAAVPPVIKSGLASGAGHRLVGALAVAALVYGLSLVLGPVEDAIGTAAKARITGDLQARLMTAVAGPVGVGHLEDPDVVDRVARAEGSLTGYFPGDAPVTWASITATRLSGIVACALVSVYIAWLGPLLLVLWLLARRLVLAPVLRQASDLRRETTNMRRAWYMAGVGSKARDAKEMRVFGLTGFVSDRFRGHYDQAIGVATRGLRDVHVRAALGLLVALAAYITALVAIGLEGRAGHLGLGALATLLPMVVVTMSAGSVSYDDITFAWTVAGLPDIERLEMDLTPAAPAPAAEGSAEGLPSRALRFEGVHFAYPGAPRPVLAGVDLEIPAGTSLALVGQNGAGKSTLVSLLGRQRDATAGRITVDGVDVCDLSAAAWQRQIAIVPQSPVRYPFSAYESVALGAIEHQADRDGVERAAQAAGFLEVVDTLPRGWGTLLARELPGGVDLSGGQWQRLALARALFATYHGARVLVLDEPTAALDIPGEARFYAHFLEITHGLTTVLISHRFATVRQAARIAVLDQGRIAEYGSHQELVAAGGLYARMYALQASRFRGAR